MGQPAPAFANGLVVAGFGSGDLVCIRADTGTVIWSDSLGGGAAPASLVNFSSIRGRPVIANGQVFAIGMGGLTVGVDLPTGRRLWDRDVAGLDSPWVAGDWMFVVSADQKMAAISTRDGSVAWVTDLPRWETPEKQKDPISWYRSGSGDGSAGGDQHRPRTRCRSVPIPAKSSAARRCPPRPRRWSRWWPRARC